MYKFLLNMWITKRINIENIQNSVTKEYISQDEADLILATPQT